MLFQAAHRLTARMLITAFAQSDKLLDDGFQFFGFWQSRFDLLMLDQRPGHICKHRFAVFVSSVQAAVTSGVTHFVSPFTFCFVWGLMRVNPSLLGRYCPVEWKAGISPPA